MTADTKSCAIWRTTTENLADMNLTERPWSRDEFDGLYRLVRTQALAELVFGDAERARLAS